MRGALSGLIFSVAASSASASYASSHDGIAYGLNNTYGAQSEYYWARASYGVLARAGAPVAAKLACDIALDEPAGASLCYRLAKEVVKSWTAYHPQDFDHGVLLNWHPHERPHFGCVHVVWNGITWLHTQRCALDGAY